MYDWDDITTMAHAFPLSQSSVCLAHSHNARVVFTIKIPPTLLRSNTTIVQQLNWVHQLVDRVESLGGDGLNVDYEEEVRSNDKTTQQALTLVTQLLQIELKKRNPYSSLVWDFGWKPSIDDRYYEYDKLAAI